jgi:hypothetical protein
MDMCVDGWRWMDGYVDGWVGMWVREEVGSWT